MKSPSFLLWFPLIAIHCKTSEDASLTAGEPTPLDGGDPTGEVARTDGGSTMPHGDEAKPRLDGGGGDASGGQAGESSAEAGIGGGTGPSHDDCFLPQQNQDIDYASATGCPCAGEDPVCVATASGSLQNLACIDGVWSAEDTGPCDGDRAGESCRDPFDCVSLVGYRCRDLDAWNEGDDVEPVWVLDPTLRCPMLTEEQCWDLEDELLALIASDDSCDSDEDCVQLGGVDANDACDCSPYLGPYAASQLGDIEAITAKYEELEAGSCAQPVCDAAPQEAECVQGTCQIVGPDSCFGSFDGGF